jgi:DNA-binding NarL/FixJ family response regulator
MDSKIAPAILIVGEERMIRELIAFYVRQNAPELDVTEAESLGCVEPAVAREARLVVIVSRFGHTRGTFVELAEARRMAPAAMVAIIVNFNDADTIRQALDLGVSGLMSTDAPAESLVHYMRLLVLDGVVLLPRLLHLWTPDEAADGSQHRAAERHERELKVLQLLRGGKSYKQIGLELAMNEGEVKLRVRALMRRFGVRNRVQLLLATNNLAAEAG